ncbi:unnamed protein product [Prunus armeniaca]
MDREGSASGSGSAPPTLDLNVLLKKTRCTLNKFLETKNPYDNDKITRVYQKIFRLSVIESRGITRGYLQPHEIIVGDGRDVEFKKAWLLNRPEEDNPTAPTYREQFDSLRLFDFKQLQRHPLLLSSTEITLLVYRVFICLNTEETSSWKNDFRQMIQRNVEVRDTVLGVDYFSDVYNSKGPQYYEENALGAFLYSADAILDVNGYIRKAFTQYTKDEEKGEKLMTVEQIFDVLISFFPHMLIDVYDFLVKKGILVEIAIWGKD